MSRLSDCGCNITITMPQECLKWGALSEKYQRGDTNKLKAEILFGLICPSKAQVSIAIGDT